MNAPTNIDHDNDKITPEAHAIDFLKNYFAKLSRGIKKSITKLSNILIASIFESKVVDDLLQKDFFEFSKKNIEKICFSS